MLILVKDRCQWKTDTSEVEQRVEDTRRERDVGKMAGGWWKPFTYQSVTHKHTHMHTLTHTCTAETSIVSAHWPPVWQRRIGLSKNMLLFRFLPWVESRIKESNVVSVWFEWKSKVRYLFVIHCYLAGWAWIMIISCVSPAPSHFLNPKKEPNQRDVENPLHLRKRKKKETWEDRVGETKRRKTEKWMHVGVLDERCGMVMDCFCGTEDSPGSVFSHDIAKPQWVVTQLIVSHMHGLMVYICACFCFTVNQLTVEGLYSAYSPIIKQSLYFIHTNQTQQINWIKYC